jgi:hypothetical protein
MRLSIWLPSVVAFGLLAGCGDGGPVGPEPVGETAAADLVQGSATTVAFRSASTGYYFGMSWQYFPEAGCTGAGGSVMSFPAVTSTGLTLLVSSWASVRVTASNVSSQGEAFASWSGTDGLSSADPGVCIPAPLESQTYTAAYGQTANSPPVLDPVGPQVVSEGDVLGFTATASDAETAAAGLSFVLGPEAPSGAVITTSGVFSWTPGESDGPASHAFSVCVRDDANPPLSDCEAVTVTVLEVNRAPVLEPIADLDVDVGSELSFTALASDPDEPANGLTFSLTGAPVGATIDPVTGAFTWTPVRGGDVAFDVVVTDDGSPARSASQTVNVSVAFVPPELMDIAPPSGSVVRAGSRVDVTGAFVAPGSHDHGVCRAMAETDDRPMVMGSDGSGTGTCTSALVLPAAGIWSIMYVVTDDNGLSDSGNIEVVAYDPGAGAVVANGWIESGVGALTTNGSATGRAIFNFNSRYVGSAIEPTGPVAFQLHSGGLTFRGLTQEWLIVDPGRGTASFRGTGRITGEAGSFGYRVDLEEGQHDGVVRIRIWRGDDESDLVYDNGIDQIIGGGSVTIRNIGRR